MSMPMEFDKSDWISSVLVTWLVPEAAIQRCSKDLKKTILKTMRKSQAFSIYF